MTELLCNPKIKAEHLARKAIVCLRQSSEKQVRQNKESQRLQFDLAERMRLLGWREVADKSGTSHTFTSFQRCYWPVMV